MLRKLKDKFSRPGIIDARARYRTAARLLRNSGLDNSEIARDLPKNDSLVIISHRNIFLNRISYVALTLKCVIFYHATGDGNVVDCSSSEKNGLLTEQFKLCVYIQVVEHPPLAT
jgi:hypothetical protein